MAAESRTFENDDAIACQTHSQRGTETDNTHDPTTCDPATCNVVLVVDDSPTILLFVKRALEQAGIHTCAARTASEAIALISKTKPALILLDMSIEGDDEEPLIQRLSRDGIFQRTRVILYSNRVESVLQAAATRYGASGYLRKSGNAREVIAAVSTELARLADTK